MLEVKVCFLAPCKYPSTRALLPPSRAICSLNFPMKSSLGILILLSGKEFSGSLNCRWQNVSSATSAGVVESLATAERHVLTALASSNLGFGEKGTLMERMGVSVTKTIKQKKNIFLNLVQHDGV